MMADDMTLPPKPDSSPRGAPEMPRPAAFPVLAALASLAIAGCTGPSGAPPGPVQLTQAEADSVLAVIEKDRVDTQEWLKGAPTSYLAAVSRRDFGDMETLTIGRKAGNDLRVDDPAVAENHLTVTVVGDSFHVQAVDPGATFRYQDEDLREATMVYGGITIGRFLLRLSNQRFPAIIVLDPESESFAKYKGIEYWPPNLDLRYELPLDLEQAVFGATVNIDVPTLVTCDTCRGSGAKPGTSPKTCSTCSGAGQVRIAQGFFSIQQTCPNCRGTGQTIETPCTDCGGRGRTQQTKTLAVKIPAGVDDGDRIRLTGEGEAGQNGGPAGDLYVEVRVRRHPIFERNGADLTCVIPISFAAAALGGTIQVPTLQGEVALKVPAETQSGRVFRLRGKGVRPVRGLETGDLYCRVEVETPVNLTAEQKRLLEAFNQALTAGGDRHRPRSSSWLDGVRRFFENIGT